MIFNLTLIGIGIWFTFSTFCFLLTRYSKKDKDIEFLEKDREYWRNAYLGKSK